MTGAAPPTQAPARAAPARPGHVTAAGVILIVAGVLTILFGLIFLLVGTLVGGAIGQFAPEMEAIGGALTGFLIIFALIVAGVGILLLVTGIKVLGGRAWARVVGIVLAILGAIFSLAGLGAEDGGIVLNIVFLVAWAYAAWALFANGAWFESRRAVP